MTWVPVIVLAALAFLAAVVLLKVAKAGWTLLGAALLFGLAGYALQGSPGQPAASGEASEKQTLDGELMVKARRAYFDTSQMPSRWVLTGDGFARRGDFAQAVGFYRSAAQENAEDEEAWLALGIALVEHADGTLTPAALTAFERAQALDEENAGPRYFLGLAWLRAGEAERTAALWREALEAAPDDAPWRESLALRLGQLERMLNAAPANRASAGQRTSELAPDIAPPSP